MSVIGGKSSGLDRRLAGKVVTWAGSVEKVVDFVGDVAFMTRVDCVAPSLCSRISHPKDPSYRVSSPSDSQPPRVFVSGRGRSIAFSAGNGRAFVSVIDVKHDVLKLFSKEIAFRSPRLSRRQPR